MRARIVVGALFLAAALGALWWVLGRAGKERAAPAVVDAAAPPVAAAPDARAAPIASPDARVAAAARSDAGGAPRRPREAAIRDKVEAALRQAAPDTTTIESITCDPDECRVVLETRDLAAWGKAQARLEEPGTGFAGEADAMLLEPAEALGPSGPWRVSFRLRYGGPR